ncbi:interactor of constitutive active ROPs 4-like [Coffea arabica]|uniref:Interactor of constitutive active ROPs 4-like n=1 Tax=Coffea arabica TaxID=13443 RepID=A0ABM4UD08_COFAR|nr:interactor of constitutive active ROPs 1-like [Coffea arabica]
MPRSSGPEMPQRRSPRPSQLRTSSSDSEPLHHRATTDRSPKLGGDRRSPRGTQPDPLNQKKLGTRIADLESQLGQAQEELRNLKEQLVSAEAAKKAAQEQLEKKTRKPIAPEPEEAQDKNSSQMQDQESRRGNRSAAFEISEENQQETDVFEVPVEKVTFEPDVEVNQQINEDDLKPGTEVLPTEFPAILKPEKPSVDELALKNDEINMLKVMLEEKEKELAVDCQENENLKCQLKEKSLEISAAQSKEEEISTRLNEVTKELEASKNNSIRISEKLEAVEKAKEELEAEMKKLRVQTEQWRKAADAAAAVLSGGVEMNGRRISDRCGSMDKHFGSVFEAQGGGYHGYLGSPGMVDDTDDVFGGGKRKGSGMRMFDLWKKKGQK